MAAAEARQNDPKENWLLDDTAEAKPEAINPLRPWKILIVDEVNRTCIRPPVWPFAMCAIEVVLWPCCPPIRAKKVSPSSHRIRI